LYTIQEICAHFWGKDADYNDLHSATLHAAAENPDGLSWVLLFNDANPKWDSDGIIFVKSSLDLLPPIEQPEKATINFSTAVNARSDGEAGGERGVKLLATSKPQATEKQSIKNQTHRPSTPRPSMRRL
jgi:hypothetical protein